MHVFDLFAGAGGFGLGFKMAGFKISLSLEKDDWAVETLKANKSSEELILHEDIRNFHLSQIGTLSAPEIIIGGPPCQGFSVAGPFKDPDDPRNTLFKDFALWVKTFSPKIFIMENVTGIYSRRNTDGRLVLDIIKEEFESIGYQVDIWKLNAALYGVPQMRTRVFIVGNKLGCEIPPPPPTHYLNTSINSELISLKPAIRVIEAIGDLPFIESGQGTEESQYTILPFHEYQEWARHNCAYVYNHVSMFHTKRIIERYKYIQNGGNLNDIPFDLKVRKRNGEGTLSNIQYSSNYRHLKDNMISYTIPASFYSTFIHPFIPRNITSREAARIQSFPDWYIFKGKRTVISSKLLQKKGRNSENFLSQYNQIGNAVPPILSYKIAEHIKAFLFKRDILSSREIESRIFTDASAF